MNKEYVQQYAQLEKEHWWFVVRQKIILQFLKKNISIQPTRILNIGAAGGESTRWLSQLGKVSSVETEPFFLEYLEKQGIDATNASVTNMPYADNSFDLVCAFDVIEHVKEDIAAMREITRVCKPGGTICITVPAFDLLWSNHDVVNGHYRRYNKQSVELLGSHFSELQNMETRYFNFLLFLPILVVRKFQKLFKKEDAKVESDFRYFKSNISNRFLKMIFGSEVSLLRAIHFPFGVSLISAWRKTGGSQV